MDFGNRKIVIKALTGSHNYNMNTPRSDEDFKYFVVPTFEDLYNAKVFSTGKQSDELDYTAHDVRQLGSLLWKANLNFIEVLFSVRVQYDPALEWLFLNREVLASMNLPTFRNATFGMHMQKMQGMFKGTATTQPLVDEFGYDTKAASHALRCLYTLERYAETQCFKDAIFYDWNDPKREILMMVKNNQVTLDEFNGLVQFWMDNKKNKVMEFYDQFEPDTELNDELETFIMQYVKGKLLEQTF